MKVTEKRKNVVDKTDLAIVIGTRLKSFRKEAGLTLKQLAEAAELSVPLLSKIENGSIMPSVPALQALAIGLKINVGDFFRNKEDSGFEVSRGKNRGCTPPRMPTKSSFCSTTMSMASTCSWSPRS